MPGGEKTCNDCGETYHGGTDLSKYGCRCLKAKYTAAKANREALGDNQPEVASEGQQIGGQTQCEDCLGFYNKGTNLRLYGCPCIKAKLNAVFAEPEAKGQSETQSEDSEARPEKARLGGSKTCADCGESYHGGTDLSKYGCRCLKAKYTAAKANREALGDKQPEAAPEGQQIGGQTQCEDCWGFYNKGTNLRLYGCPCMKAKLEAVFAEPEAKKENETPSENSEARPEKLRLGGSKTCADCGESYHGGTDLSKYGCRCLKAKYTAAKANRETLGDKQPEAASEGQQIGGQTQCEDCWGFYNKGTNLRLYGCPCMKAKLAAVFAEPEAKGDSSNAQSEGSEARPEKLKLGGQKTCDDCGETYYRGTDLSRHGCRCLKAKYTAAKANRETSGNEQPVVVEGRQIGGQTQCEDCWGTYTKGTNYRLYGCPCMKAKLEAVFAEPNSGASYCSNLKCYQLVDADGNCATCNPVEDARPPITRQLSSRSTDLMKAFKKFDKNNSGGLDPEEFKEVVSKCLEMPVDNEYVNEFFKMAVVPGQSEVSYRAFCEFLDIKEEK